MTVILAIDKAAVARGEPNIIRIRRAGKPDIFAGSVEITGPSRFCVDMDNPLEPEGTYAWIETESKVVFSRRPQ